MELVVVGIDVFKNTISINVNGCMRYQIFSTRSWHNFVIVGLNYEIEIAFLLWDRHLKAVC